MPQTMCIGDWSICFDLSYGEVMGWIRCKPVSFALVRSAVMCIHGAQLRLHSPVFKAPLDARLLRLTFNFITEVGPCPFLLF